MRAALQRPPLWVAGAGFYRDEPWIRAALTWRDRHDEEYRAYVEASGGLLVPRNLCPESSATEDRTVAGVPADFSRLRWAPRDREQARVVSESSDKLARGRSFVIRCPTGFGKTSCAMPLIAGVGRRTMIVVPKLDLIRGRADRPQWYETVRDQLRVHPSRIGVWHADQVEVTGRDVVIGTVQSLCKIGRYPEGLYQQFGLLVVDEVHRVAADRFSAVLTQFPARLRLGLSATPTRSDGRDALIRAHLGRVEVSSDELPMIPRVLRYHVANPLLQRVPHSAQRNGHVLRMLWGSRKRNQLIAYLVGACRRKDRRVLVLSGSVDHLERIEALARLEGVSGRDCGYYVGARDAEGEGRRRQVSSAELDRASRKPVVLATYGKAGDGTNAPWWDSCIIASPRARVQQPVGRTLRRREGKKTPVVMDLVDHDSSLFLSWAAARSRWYEECGAEVVSMDWPEHLRGPSAA